MDANNYIDDGVYFKMDFEEYLKEPALSFSSIKMLWSSPLRYWTSSNVNSAVVAQKCTKNMILGSAVHKLVLEGESSYNESYVTLPSKELYPLALDGVKQLKERCRELGLPVSGTIPVLLQRIREADNSSLLWADIIGLAKESALCLTVLDSFVDNKVKRMNEMCLEHDGARSLLIGGFPEVSIFWTDRETDIRLKARLDYLTPHGIVDLKTHSNSFGLPARVAVIRAICTYKYYLQSHIYGVAAKEAVKLIGQGRCKDIFDKKWIEEFLSNTSHDFFFIFLDTEAPHDVYVSKLACDKYSAINIAGSDIFRDTLDLYLHCKQEFGCYPWFLQTGIDLLKDVDFPSWVFES